MENLHVFSNHILISLNVYVWAKGVRTCGYGANQEQTTQ